MKHNALLFLLLLLTASACNNDDDGNGNDTYTYEFFTSSQIQLLSEQGFEYIRIDNGINTVFKYRFVADDEPNIADDEYTETIYFEVNSDLSQFSYIDNELPAQQVYIQRGCFCASVFPVPVSVGSISGTKLSNGNWDIDISISFEWDEFSETDTRTISGIFSPSEQ